MKISSALPLSRIAVYSVSGSKVKELTLTGTESSARELYLGDLSAGTYVIRVFDNKGKAESRKIIKY
jgi:phage-related protein